jgi:hypothetical protein
VIAHALHENGLVPRRWRQRLLQALLIDVGAFTARLFDDTTCAFELRDADLGRRRTRDREQSREQQQA